MTQYRDTQQSSDSPSDPTEEEQHAFEAWKRSVGPQRSGRLAGAGSMGPSIFEKGKSIIPNRGESSSADSTGRSMPTAAELQTVQLLTQQLSEVQNQLTEQQRLSNEQRERHEQQMQEQRLMIEQMREQTRINEERWKRFFDMTQPQMPSMPSSSFQPQFQSQQQAYGGAFQPYGVFPSPYQMPYGSINSQQQFQQSPFQQQPQHLQLQPQQQSPQTPFHQPRQQSPQPSLQQSPQQSQQPQVDTHIDLNDWLSDPTRGGYYEDEQ